ncbi:MAG: D-alanyl-D-alanine carboxypeptidase/D-alanyl-D-alanine-endopeptidase [Balneolaceae bacterium]
MKAKLLVLSFLIIISQTELVWAQTIQSIIASAPNQEAFWSVTIRGENGEILESLNSDKLIAPASNQKLLTTAAVLDAFGSDYRYQTHIYGKGEQIGEVWNGDLIIKGSGDPSISGFMYNDNRYHVFEQFLVQLEEKNITEISGNIIADLSLFDRDYYPKGWDWYDFSFYYGVQISPLSFNNNAVDLEVFADGEVGGLPGIKWFPDSTNYVEFVNEQVITNPSKKYDEYYRRGFGNNTIVLRSGLPQGYYETESLSVDNPELFFLDSFSKFIQRNGIYFDGELEISISPAADSSLPVLATHQSVPMGDLVAWTNKESDNLFAEMLLKTLSAAKGDEAGSFEHGVNQVRTFLADSGIDTSFVLMNDGSGLAIGNFTKTSIISDLLYKMMGHPEWNGYLKSMSIAGIDGTVAHRMKGTPLYNNFKGKSGFVTGVRTLSGYFEAKSGKKIIVSLATNNFVGKVRPVDAIHEEILQYLYNKY